MLSCMDCLYIFEINPYHLQIFSPILVIFLFCLWFSFCAKGFKIDQVLCLFLLLCKVNPKRDCYDICQRVFCLCFPLRVYSIQSYI